MRRYGPSIIILALVIVHVVDPTRVQIDWQSVALVSLIIALVYAPELSAVLPLIKRVKIGAAEIEMRESLKKLHDEVEEAESATGVGPTLDLKVSANETCALSENTENRILALAARDKESAVVRLAIEIEKALSLLFQNAGLGEKPPRTIRDTVEQLISKGILPPKVGEAIIEFRNVRNKVIHPMAGALVDDSILTSAIDSGLRILRLLRQS